jgi:hypothetical protein
VTTILVMPEPKPTPETPDGYPARRIEWVGEQSVMDEPFVWTGIATGRFTKDQEALLRRMALRREVRTQDTIRLLGVNDLGLSRDYVWSRQNRYICLMTFADADKVLSSPDGHCFRDLDAMEPDQPQVLYPPVELRLVSESVLKTGIDQLQRVV